MYQIRFKLANVLENKGISRRELSRLTSIRHPSINEMCNNETERLPLKNLAQICQTLNVEIDDVLELIKDKDTQKKDEV